MLSQRHVSSPALPIGVVGSQGKFGGKTSEGMPTIVAKRLEAPGRLQPWFLSGG